MKSSEWCFFGSEHKPKAVRGAQFVLLISEKWDGTEKCYSISCNFHVRINWTNPMRPPKLKGNIVSFRLAIFQIDLSFSWHIVFEHISSICFIDNFTFRSHAYYHLQNFAQDWTYFDFRLYWHYYIEKKWTTEVNMCLISRKLCSEVNVGETGINWFVAHYGIVIMELGSCQVDGLIWSAETSGNFIVSVAFLRKAI